MHLIDLWDYYLEFRHAAAGVLQQSELISNVEWKCWIFKAMTHMSMSGCVNKTAIYYINFELRP